MTQTVLLRNINTGQKLGLDIAANSLFALHNIVDSVCFYCEFKLDPELEKLVREYKPEIV